MTFQIKQAEKGINIILKENGFKPILDNEDAESILIRILKCMEKLTDKREKNG